MSDLVVFGKPIALLRMKCWRVLGDLVAEDRTRVRIRKE